MIDGAAIYVIVNRVNNKLYLGSALNFKRRRREHICKLRAGKHHNKYLQRAWDKYGAENFEIFPIEYMRGVSSGALIERETKWIRGLNLIDCGYNLQEDPQDQAGEKNPMWGKTASAETRAKMSVAHSGKKNGNYGNRGPRNPLYGKKHSLEVVAKTSGKNNGMYGVHLAGKNNGMYGKTHTAEARERMRIAATGRRHTPEAIEKIRLASSKQRHSAETLKKMSIAQKKRWARYRAALNG